jgi:hypothetical protein
MSTVSDAIRIEDEVWQEAFSTRLASPRRRREEFAERERIIPAERLRAAPERPAEPAARPAQSAPQPAQPARPPRPAPAVTTAAPARRTVTITGRGAERHLPWPGDGQRRRPSRALHERAGFRPDRLAMWAVFLGLLLVIVAISSHG